MPYRSQTIPQGVFSDGEVFAVISRCGCGDPNSHSKLGLPCPTPREVEIPGNNGLIAKVGTEDIHAFTVERDPTIPEFVGDKARALRNWTFKAYQNIRGKKHEQP